jgi:excisionase family DNA binding protein
MTETPLLTVQQVADHLGVSRHRLYAWRHEGKGPPVIQLEGRLLRYSQADLAAWLDAQQEGDGPAKDRRL